MPSVTQPPCRGGGTYELQGSYNPAAFAF